MLELPPPVEYTNREIGLILENMNKNIKTFMKVNTTEHTMVIEKQNHTNGRVRKLEKFIWALGGAIVILGWQITNVDKIRQVAMALIK